MKSTGIYLNGFTPNSTSRIRPGMKYCSNWVEIHCMPARSNWVSSLWITPNLSSISCPVELGIIPINGFTPNSTGHEILLKMGVNSLRLIVCLPGRIGYHSNEFNWHLSQWIYSQFDQSNSTGHEILLKLG